MASRFKTAKWLILFQCIVRAGGASVQPLCAQCSLPCDEAPELDKYDRVIVAVQPPSEKDEEEVIPVSKLRATGRCLVPGCFQRDSQYALTIYAVDDESVPKILLNKASLQPDCSPESRSGTNSAVGKFSNIFVILLGVLLYHLLQP